jgi:predicted unusual protein kinase regulating ubiquinone biosynthesis (AarF/ABC1/UbiB family)
MSGLLPKGFDLQPYLEEGRKQLHEETDYRREGTQLTRFRALLADDPRFVVPKRFEEWSTQSILAMSHVSGCPIEEMHTAPQDLRNRIMTELIDLTLQELLEFGVMQTDPNFANYRFQTDSSRIVLLDFGATRDLDPIIVAQYRRLLRAGLAGDTAAIDKTARDIGFIGSQTKDRHSAQIVRMIGMVFDALKVAPLVEFTNTEMSQRMQTEGIALAEDGFVPPPLPIDVLLLQRKFGGMFLLGARLGAQVDVIALLERHLRDLE